MKQPNYTASFVRSAGKASEFPRTETPELCLLGRSNVGKSSFINHVFTSRGLARVSKTPGKTILANFYQVSDGWCWVDLPGYGYAKRSHTELNRLSTLVHSYCENREQLRGLLWLLDVRHPGVAADREAFSWLARLNLPVLGVLTKCDKVSTGRLAALRKQYASLYPGVSGFIAYSTLRSGPRQSFWSAYESWTAGLGG